MRLTARSCSYLTWSASRSNQGDVSSRRFRRPYLEQEPVKSLPSFEPPSRFRSHSMTAPFVQAVASLFEVAVIHISALSARNNKGKRQKRVTQELTSITPPHVGEQIARAQPTPRSHIQNFFHRQHLLLFFSSFVFSNRWIQRRIPPRPSNSDESTTPR